MEYSVKRKGPSLITTFIKPATENEAKSNSSQVNKEKGKLDASPELPPTVASTSQAPSYLL